jgi:trehalose synthase-fused probable maltokinase
MTEEAQSVDAVFRSEEGRRRLETEVLPACLQRSRWFGGKARALQRVAVGEVIGFGAGAALVLVEVHYAAGESETYQLPLLHARRASVEALLRDEPSALIADFGETVLVDALFSPEFRAELWRRLAKSSEPVPESRVLTAEQSNSSLLYGDRAFVKIFRRIQSGVNPDAEILRFLSEERKFRHVPAYLGSLERPDASGVSTLLAIATAAVRNRSDAWSFALSELKDFYARTGHGAPSDPAHIRSVVGDAMLGRIAQLGTRTGELHVALAGVTANPDFAPEPLTKADFETLRDNILSLWDEVTATAPTESSATLAAVAPLVRQRARDLTARCIAAKKCRTHGDYHLGQVLETGSDFVIIDFEGEPARTLAERRRKQSPVRDVAGMVRSLHYAAHAARGDDSEWEKVWAEAWSTLTKRAFLSAWRDATAGASFRPATDAELDTLVRAFLLEKAIYEIRYELNNRPTWLHIPLRGLQQVLTGV